MAKWATEPADIRQLRAERDAAIARAEAATLSMGCEDGSNREPHSTCPPTWEADPRGMPDATQARLPQIDVAARPFAWVIPGDDNEDMNGFIDARITEEGEFTKPLYDEAALSALQARAEAAEAERDRFEKALARACLVGSTTYLVERAEAAEAEAVEMTGRCLLLSTRVIELEAALPSAWEMGRDAAVQIALNKASANHLGPCGGAYLNAASAIRALTPPADLASRVKGGDA